MRNLLLKNLLLISSAVLLATVACQPDRPVSKFAGAENEVTIMNMNPGHFHAGLIHLHDYPQIDPKVYVYAPEGNELNSYLNMVNRFNTRAENPTRWEPVVYTGDDYLERMLREKPGNVMVMAGNNSRKIEYVASAIENGINVLSDKPMIITPVQFPRLREALESADEQGLVLNDMMTERHEITTILQKELSHMPELFGELIPGSPEQPAIEKESVHFFYKTVAGATLIRPPWFFDTTQQGEAIVDVSTHLVDKVLWQVFPGQPIDYRNPDHDVDVVEARIWPTPLTADQFELITTVPGFPEYLQNRVENGVLQVNANGEFVFRVQGVYAKVGVLWGFTNPDGGDTHYSIMRGTKANLVVRQDLEQDFKATLYVEPLGQEGNETGSASGHGQGGPAAREAGPEHFEAILNDALASLSERYPGLSAHQTQFGWEISVPEEYVETHEEHFTRVTERFLDALIEGRIPEWERRNLETKYYLTTRAYEMSR